MKHYLTPIERTIAAIGAIICFFMITTLSHNIAHYYCDFSPHEPGTQAHTSSSSQPGEPAQLDYLPSTVEIQRELNRRNPKAKLKEDGVCGVWTQKEWDIACGNQYSLEFWPEDAR